MWNTWGNYSKNTTRLLCQIVVPCQQHSDFVSLTAVQWGYGLTCDRTYFLAPKGLPFASSKEQSKKKYVLRIKCNVFLSSSRSFCNCCWFALGSKLFHVWAKPFRSLCNEHLYFMFCVSELQHSLCFCSCIQPWLQGTGNAMSQLLIFILSFWFVVFEQLLQCVL